MGIWRRPGDMKLRNKLLISYLVASMIPIVIITFTIYRLSADSVEEASREFASMYISQATTNLDEFVQRYDQTTQSVLLESDIMQALGSKQPATMDALIENKGAIQRFFIRIMTVSPEIETVMLVSNTGALYHYTKTMDSVNVPVLQAQPWYEHILDREKTMFITPAHDRSYYANDRDRAAFTVGRVLWNYNGSYAGMILFDMNPSQLIRLNNDFLQLGNQYDIRLVITDDEGGVIYHSDAATGKLPWKEVMGRPYGSGEAGSRNDTIMLNDSANEGRLLLTTEIPINKLLAKIDGIKHVTMWAIAASLMFIGMMSILYSYRITKPIHELRKSMKQVELGHYSSLIRVPAANDEIRGLVTSYNKMILRIKALIEDVFVAGMKRKQAKLLALQSQINPHMLYNTLESIRMKAVVKEQDEIAEMIKVLARMFKLSLGRERERHLVRHEVEYAVNYLYLQNIRYDNRFTLDVRLSDEVLDTPIIPLVFQPLVENSIKHGFRDYDKHLHMVIEEERVGPADVLIRIADNGAALSGEEVQEINELLQQADYGSYHTAEDERDTESGIGLRNIAERIKLQYGDRYGLTIAVAPGTGMVVEMRIPLRQEKE